MKKLLLLLLSCFGAFSADYAERGTNFTGYSASTTISNQANAYVLVYDGGYSSGSRTRSISVTNFLALAPGGTLRANGTVVATPNLTNSTYLSVVVDGSNIYFYPTNLTAAHLATDSVSADELNATGVESELEAVLDLSDLQGAVTDAQVPNNITVDLATLATTATTANAGDSATAFFSSGEIEDARLPSALTRDSEIVGAILNPNLIASLNTQTPEFSGTSGTNMIPSTNNLITWDGTQAGRSWVFNLSGSSDPGWLFSDGVVQMTNHLRFGADNTWDIGASGATRPRNLFLAGSGTFGGALTLGTSIFFGVNAALTPMSSGVLRITDGSFADFNRLTLGGTSSSYPAIKRSTTQLQVKLADDSAFTSVGLGILELNQVAAGGTPASNAGRVYAKDGAGTAEVYTMDEAGNETLQTPHPDDAPANMDDRQDGLQDEFAKTANYYLGKIEWINITRLARFNQRLLNNTNWLNLIGETNLAALPVARRRVYHVETFNQYNARTGTTNPLVQLDWATVQEQHQTAYNSARSLELAAYNTPITEVVPILTNILTGEITLQTNILSAVNTNITVRPVADVRKPKPAWMP